MLLYFGEAAASSRSETSSWVLFCVLWFVQSAETRITNSFFAEWFSPIGRAGFSWTFLSL